jgi:hypothetical protein
MELTKNLSVKMDIIPSSKGIVTCEFEIKRSKKTVKINVDILLYCQNTTYSHMTDMITAGVQSVNTTEKDTIHSLKFTIPEFIDKGRKQSFLIISLGQGEDPYSKVYIENIKVNASPSVANAELQQQVQQQIVQQVQQQIVQQAQKPKVLCQSPADQLLASTITPNARPRTFASAPADPFTQYATQQNINRRNIQIQDVQPRQGTVPQLQQTSIQDNKTQEHFDKIVLVSTWNVKCGIALYTEDLYNEFNKLYPDLFMINPINRGMLQNNIKAKLTHLQHEFGIMPNPPPVEGKVIMTWHTIPRNMENAIRRFESALDIVAHIALCEGAREYIRTAKDVHIVSLGSKLMDNNIKKEDAKKIVGLSHINKPIGFVFGYQSPNKNYARLTNAARSTGIHLVISGSTHCSGYRSNILNNEHVTFLNRYLTDEEIDMFALASDMLLLDYADQDHYSSSSALHRTVGSSRPIICARTKHFGDIREDVDGALKFSNQEELEKCIRNALERKEELGTKALEFAKRTSREEAAKQHIRIYRKYVDI